MNDELISVIIPAYNAEKTIKHAVDSVLKQKYSNVEILVINDGSTDKTDEIIQKIIKYDKRVKIINTINYGVSHARNVGIKVASGSYIVFLDADDFIDEEMLLEMYNTLKKYEVNLVKCDNRVIRNNISSNDEEKYKMCGFIRTEELIKHIISYKENIKGYACGYMFKKDSIVLFDENLSYMEDTDFLLKVLYKNEYIYVMDKVFYNYIINNNSVTNEKKDIGKKCIKILDSIISMENTLIKNNMNYNDMNNFYVLYYQYIVKKMSAIKKNKEILKVIKNKNFIKLIKKVKFAMLKRKQKIGYILLKFKLYNIFIIILKINENRSKK